MEYWQERRMAVSTGTRLPRDDRFTEPNAEQLRDGLTRESLPLFDTLREHLLSLEGVTEQVAWYGISWRWSLEYRRSGDDDALAVLVPCPDDLRLAMPIDQGFINSLRKRQLKRAVRDGLELASEPFDTRWGVWSVPFANLVDDLRSLVNLKARYLEG